jgi:hypothetical protein
MPFAPESDDRAARVDAAIRMPSTAGSGRWPRIEFSAPTGRHLCTEEQRGGVEIHRIEEDERRCVRAVNDAEPGCPLVDPARGERDQA